MTTIPLHPELFTTEPRTILRSQDFEARALRYPSGVASLRLTNSRGLVEVLSFMGQIIWDAQMDGVSLRMDNMFSQPQPAQEIVGTYGCFAFHAGLLAAGCPSPQDDHPLHGEFPCAPMDEAWLEVKGDAVRIVSSYEYVMGFGSHYRAQPHVEMRAGSSMMTIGMRVANLSAYAPMPLQYMCHMNYAFVPDGVMSQSLPEGSFQLRRTVPAHVTPNPEWDRINEDILAGRMDADSLEGATAFDPEIVYFADGLERYDDELIFEIASSQGHVFQTRFLGKEFPVATRWILHNPDQKVASFVLPGISRPEGFIAAREAGALIMLGAGESRSFTVTTGLKEN